MIRFVEMKGIYADRKAFCFYDTVTDNTLQIGDLQVFDSIKEFLDEYPYKFYVKLDRLLELIPKGWIGESCKNLIDEKFKSLYECAKEDVEQEYLTDETDYYIKCHYNPNGDVDNIEDKLSDKEFELYDMFKSLSLSICGEFGIPRHLVEERFGEMEEQPKWNTLLEIKPPSICETYVTCDKDGN